jgi:hypothetical protein
MSITLALQVGGSIDVVLHPPPPAISTRITTRVDSLIVTAWSNHMAYTLAVDKLIVVQVAYLDAAQNPARIDGAVAWSSSNDAVAHVDVDPQDSTICKITPQGALGSAQIIAEADADLGTGVRSLLTTLDLTIVGGEAVAGTINVVGDPQPIAPHPEQQTG